MAPLEALELDYPLIDSNFRSFCSSRGIFTVEDFLLHDQYEFEAFLEQECEPDKLKQGLAQLLSVVESHHQPWLNGLELLEDAELNKGFISTGCERIDVLLQGGLRVGQVTELVGPSSSGKTQVCLKIASHVARKSGSIMYFDSGNSFSPKRIAQFLCQPTDSIHIEVEKTVQQVMSSIVCHSVFDIFTLLDMLHQLMNNLKSQTLCSIKMLIIDSLSSLIAPILGGGGAQGHAIMVTAGYLLKELACGRNISVVPAENIGRAVRAMNEIQVGGKPIKANIVRYPKQFAPAAMKSAAVRQAARAPMRKAPEVLKFAYNPEPDEERWLELCLVATLQGVSRPAILKEIRGREGLESIKISMLTGDRVLIQADSVVQRDCFLQEENKWEEVGLLNVQRWSLQAGPHPHDRWMRLTGIPPNVWNHRFFTKLMEPIGELLQVEEYKFEERPDYTAVRVLVRKKDLNKEVSGIDLTVKDQVFPVQITEEVKQWKQWFVKQKGLTTGSLGVLDPESWPHLREAGKGSVSIQGQKVISLEKARKEPGQDESTEEGTREPEAKDQEGVAANEATDIVGDNAGDIVRETAMKSAGREEANSEETELVSAPTEMEGEHSEGRGQAVMTKAGGGENGNEERDVQTVPDEMEHIEEVRFPWMRTDSPHTKSAARSPEKDIVYGSSRRRKKGQRTCDSVEKDGESSTFLGGSQELGDGETERSEVSEAVAEAEEPIQWNEGVEVEKVIASPGKFWSEEQMEEEKTKSDGEDAELVKRKGKGRTTLYESEPSQESQGNKGSRRAQRKSERITSRTHC